MARALYSFFILFLLSGSALGLDARAVVDRTHVGPGESVGLSVTINGGQGTVDVSPIEDFKVLSRGSGTSVKIVNGSMSKEVTYNYTLLPKKSGPLKIPPLTVSTDEGDLLTKEITITVSESSEKVKKDQDVFLTAMVSENTPYAGQQIIYSFKFFHAVQIANAQLVQEPEFDGFASKKIGEDRSYKTVLSGKAYGVIERKYILVPLEAGHLSIEPAILRCDLVRRGRSRGGTFDSFFDDPFFGRTNLETKVFTSSSIRIDVKPLPSYKLDVPFSGLVGNFEFEAQIDKKQMKVGDSSTLSLVVSGSGNVMDAEEPSVKIPDSFKMYKDSPEEDITLDARGYSGKKIFRMALVPTAAGKVNISPITYSFFNVEKKRYELFRTPEIPLTVMPSDEKETVAAFSAQPKDIMPGFKKEQVRFTGRDILSVKEDMDALENKSHLSFFRFLLFWMIPLLFGTAAKIYVVFSDKLKNETAVMEQRVQATLKKARCKDLTPEMFFSNLHTALISKVLAIAGTKGESLTAIEMEQTLISKGYPPETVKEAVELLNRIESFRYGGAESDAKNWPRLLSETKAMIRRLS